MLGIEGRGGAIAGDFFDEIVPPEIAAFFPADFFAGAADDYGFFDGGTFVESDIGGFFERNDFSAAIAAVGGD